MREGPWPRPGLFLAGAAALGALGGRLSRGLVADHQDASIADLKGNEGKP